MPEINCRETLASFGRRNAQAGSPAHWMKEEYVLGMLGTKQKYIQDSYTVRRQSCVLTCAEEL